MTNRAAAALVFTYAAYSALAVALIDIDNSKHLKSYLKFTLKITITQGNKRIFLTLFF